MLKILKWLVLSVVLGVFLLWGRGWLVRDQHPVSQERPLIGLIQVIEHPALDQTRQGIMDELKDAGYIPEKNIQWLCESAQGNPALATQIAQKFVGQRVSVIVTLGTTPSQAAVQVATKMPLIPIVFSSVTDPVSAKLVANPQKPEQNATGVSNYVDVERQFKIFQKILPSLKKIGVIYNPGEANSVTLIEKMQQAVQKNDLVLLAVPASKTSDVMAAAQSLVGKVDAIFINNDNTALAAFDAVAKVGQDHDLPVFVSDVDFLNKGALAALGPDQYALGRQTGKMIVRILKDQVRPENIPVEWPKNVELKINFDVARRLKIQLMKDLISQAEREGAD